MSAPFAGITQAAALATLKSYLLKSGVKQSRDYRCHDLRRVRADDVRLAGSSPCEILMAGEWCSPAFMDYLDKQELIEQVVLHTHVDDSSSEDDAF